MREHSGLCDRTNFQKDTFESVQITFQNSRTLKTEFLEPLISDSIYLYYYIKHHIKQIEQLGTGTTFKEVSRDDLCKFPILTIGAKDIYVQWIELQNVIADKQLALTKEIAALTKQRDELLPLLMKVKHQ